MAWWEWVPGASTVGHAIRGPRGTRVSDYAACAPDLMDRIERPAIARAASEQCIDRLMYQYLSEWLGVPLSSGILKSTSGVAIAKLSRVIAGLVLKRSSARATSIVSGVGAFLAADAIIDAGIVFQKSLDIIDTAKQAKSVYCVYPAPGAASPSAVRQPAGPAASAVAQAPAAQRNASRQKN